MTKDMQRAKIFRAEQQLSNQPMSPDAVETMVDTIARSRWWGTRRPDLRTIQVKDRPVRVCFSPQGDTGGFGFIAPGTAPTQWHVIHSLAHLLRPHSDHGPEFAMAYIKLTARFLGKDAEVAVRDAFREGRIRTYTHSPEAKEEAKKKAAQLRFTATIERARQLQAELEAEVD